VTGLGGAEPAIARTSGAISTYDSATISGREDERDMLPTHGRYDYSNITKRPDYAWPGGRRLAVYVALHPFVTGRPYRIRRLRRALQHVLEHPDRVWLTRPCDICAHVASLPEGVVPGSR
jgi:hypothetical protein